MTKTKIKKILQQHGIWLASLANEGERANLNHADLIGADLTGADLRAANLRGANLYSANLTGANLTGANLNCADLYGAILDNADLRDASLCNVSLISARLLGVNFSNVNLTGTNFHGSMIERGSIEQSILDEGAAQEIGLPDISWIIPGALCKLNEVRQGFLCQTQAGIYKSTFTDNTLGFFIQDNAVWNTFDILVEDKIIRGIPHWVKYTGLRRMPEYLGE
jgi:hypothetical protein